MIVLLGNITFNAPHTSRPRRGGGGGGSKSRAPGLGEGARPDTEAFKKGIFLAITINVHASPRELRRIDGTWGILTRPDIPLPWALGDGCHLITGRLIMLRYFTDRDITLVKGALEENAGICIFFACIVVLRRSVPNEDDGGDRRHGRCVDICVLADNIYFVILLEQKNYVDLDPGESIMRVGNCLG